MLLAFSRSRNGGYSANSLKILPHCSEAQKKSVKSAGSLNSATVAEELFCMVTDVTFTPISAVLYLHIKTSSFSVFYAFNSMGTC